MQRTVSHPVSRCRPIAAAFGAAIILFATNVSANTTIVSGHIDDPANMALVGSDPSPSPPSFVDDFAVANNVALYGLVVAIGGAVEVRSSGFALGGIDPYFSVFRGSGASATFVDSNYVQAFATGGDFDLTLLLAAGSYTFAIGTFANLSFAENNGAGTLGDGFIGVGEPSSLGNAFYRLTVTTPDSTTPGGPGSTVPEPATGLLIAGASLALLKARRPRLAAPRPGSNSSPSKGST